MDEANVRYLLSQLKIPHNNATFTGSVKRTRWMTISCPFAPWTHQKKTDNHPSFGITLKDGDRSAYKCLSCGLKGRLSSLPTRLGGYRKLDYSKIRRWAEMTEFQTGISKPVPKWEDADPVAIDYSKKAIGREAPPISALSEYPIALGSEYLRERGIAYIDVMRMNIRYDAYQRRVLFPVYDRHDTFQGFTGRSVLHKKKWTKEYPKARDYHGLNKRDVFLKLPGQHGGKKVITEGIFDYATSVHHRYYNARAILGTSLTDEKVEILTEEGEPVYFFMDNDLAGWQALFGVFDADENLKTDLAWAFRLFREIPVWIVPYRTNLTGEDPGGILDRAAFDAHIKRAWLFTGKAPLTVDGRPSMLHPRHNKLFT